MSLSSVAVVFTKKECFFRHAYYENLVETCPLYSVNIGCYDWIVNTRSVAPTNLHEVHICHGRTSDYEILCLWFKTLLVAEVAGMYSGLNRNTGCGERPVFNILTILFILFDIGL
jgi:hypothetical protein